MLDALRAAARQARRRKIASFYTVRAVAQHFGISVATAFRYYEVLRGEGLLTPKWGANTEVGSAQLNRKREVRGVVALPVLTHSFAAVLDERELVLRIEEELWAHGFGARLMFEDLSRDSSHAEIAALARSGAVDAIVWVRPCAKARAELTTLHRNGVIAMAVDGSAGDSEIDQYLVDRTPAMMSTFRSWHRHGVRGVAVVANEREPVAALESCASSCGLAVDQWSLARTTPELLIERLTHFRGAVAFPSSRLAAELAQAAPRQFERLIRSRPVLLARGGIEIPGVRHAARVVSDVLSVDAASLAKQLVDDLAAGRHNRGQTFTTTAVYRPARAHAA